MTCPWPHGALGARSAYRQADEPSPGMAHSPAVRRWCSTAVVETHGCRSCSPIITGFAPRRARSWRHAIKCGRADDAQGSPEAVDDRTRSFDRWRHGPADSRAATSVASSSALEWSCQDGRQALGACLLRGAAAPRWLVVVRRVPDGVCRRQGLRFMPRLPDARSGQAARRRVEVYASMTPQSAPLTTTREAKAASRLRPRHSGTKRWRELPRELPRAGTMPRCTLLFCPG